MNPSQSRTTSPWIYAVLVLGVLALLFGWYVHEHPRQAVVTVASPAATASDSARLKDPERTFSLVIKGQKLVTGPSDITVKKNQSVRVDIVAQAAVVKVKLDGYGITTESAPSDNPPGGFSFIADKVGTFPFYVVTDSASVPVFTKIGTITVK